MNINRFSASGVALAVALCFTAVNGVRPQSAFALPSESVMTFQPASVREAQMEKVMSILARPDAQIQMRLAGIPQKELRSRVARMDDSQLEWASQRVDQIKAAGVLGIIIAVLVIAILVVILIWLVDKDVDVHVKDN